MLGSQNGYQNTRQAELVKKNIIIYHLNQPVLIKPVIILNFKEKLNLIYDVRLMIFFRGMSKIFNDNIHYDRTKFRIDIKSLSKVTGGSCALETPLLVSLCLYVNFSA